MPPVARAVAVPLVSLLVSLSLVSCSDDAPGSGAAAGTDSGAGVVPVEQAERAIDDGATVVDVRTPEEFRAGHLLGAVNLDVSSPDFDDQVSALDPDASYVVYCQSGNRSTTAAQAMLDAGIDDVVNAGGYADLVSAGLG